MKTCDSEANLLRIMYQRAIPATLAAGERLHIAMGLESEALDSRGQLIVLPWHMPLPRELQYQAQPGPPRQVSTVARSTIGEADVRKEPGKGAKAGPLSRTGGRKKGPSNQLERSLHNKNLAQHLSTFETGVQVPLRPKDANLPLLVAKSGDPIKANEVANNTLKRKLSKVKLPSAPKDEPVSDTVPNLSIQPAFQHRLRISEPTSSNKNEASGAQKDSKKHPEDLEYEEKSESPSPPRRRSMPPIEAVLAHGFKNLNVGRPSTPAIPRSHAFEAWTNLSLSHKVLSPTPAFLLNMTPFQYDDGEDTYYWKSSLPMILSFHLANPATLVEETLISNLTFHLPAPKPSLAVLANRKQVSRATAKQVHHKTEGVDTDTQIRMIRMILPPLIGHDGEEPQPENSGNEEVPFTDWLLLCLSNNAPIPPTSSASTRVLRSSSQAPRQPYTLIAIPTHSVAETSCVAKSPVLSAADEPKKQETTTTVLKFTGRGRSPLMFGVGRDVSFVDKWIRGFGMGLAALEVTSVCGGGPPCWV